MSCYQPSVHSSNWCLMAGPLLLYELFYFGANLTVLQKKDGGVRPVAVRCTLRHLVAKVVGCMVMDAVGEILTPRQLCVGVSGGAEAAVHAMRLYLEDLAPDKAMLKLDFRNAFNTIHRDKVLAAVLKHSPGLYPFVHSVNSSPSSLFWSDMSIDSAEGVQQGDPLGPLLFCLCIHDLGTQLRSELVLLYPDDETLGGNVEYLKHDLEVVMQVGESIGLSLNSGKSEVICENEETAAPFASLLPNAKRVNSSDASLLGSSVGNISSINNILEEKTALLKKVGDRLAHLSSHDAILLLKHSFAIPKLLYNLRTLPSFLSPALEVYSKMLRTIVSGITNIHFEESDPAWLQATLPVKLGGLGVRSAVQLAPSAFLASAAASSDFVRHIVPPTLQSSTIPFVDEAERQWLVGDSVSPPEGMARCRQNVWDSIKMKILADALLGWRKEPGNVLIFSLLEPVSLVCG